MSLKNSPLSGSASTSGITISLGTYSYGTITTTSISASYSYINMSPPKTTYHILGEDFESTEGYRSENLSIIIATLNVLGKPYYDELKKQNIHFSNDMDEFIRKRLLIIERDKKINSVITKSY